jgi:hypothetical protein
MKLDAYGKKIEILRENELWILYELGEGKKHVLTILYSVRVQGIASDSLSRRLIS